MDVFSMLKEDHKKVAGLLKKADGTEVEDREKREDLFEQIKNELETHTRLEETIFYPHLDSHEETEEIVREAHEEHALVKGLLGELESLPKDDEQWGAKFTVLKENVEHHVEEEEGEMFKKVKKALDKEELDQISDELARAKGLEPPSASRSKAAARKPQARSKSKKTTAKEKRTA